MSASVHTHEPPLARPGEFFRGLWRDLRRSHPLAQEIARRDIRNQHRLSLLGPIGVVLPPCAMTAVALGFQQAGILNIDSAELPYGLFVLVGTVLWTTFVEALMAPIYGLLSEHRLLARTTAPPESIVIGKLGLVMFNVVVKAGLLAAALAWYGFAIPATAIFALVGLVGLVALGTAVGLALAPLNLFYRDISRLLTVVTAFWLVFSPVYFPPPSRGAVSAIMTLNPVTPILTATRSLLLTGRVADPVEFAWVCAGAVTALMVSWVGMRIVLRVAIEQVNE